MAKDVAIPSVADLFWPLLKAVQDLGGSAKRAKLLEQVLMNFTEEQLAISPSGSAGSPQVVYRAQWALHSLKRIDMLDNSTRGVYAVTEKGVAVLRLGEAAADAALRKMVRKKGRKPPDPSRDDVPLPEDLWKTSVLDELKKMDPAAFERLAQRVLLEAGFQKVDVLGRTGDGGIDGVGLYRMSLVSFQIYFQCKRFAGRVSAGVVRDFRGAMVGRGNKGLVITTGTFTPSAQDEATRDGAPPIDLIDGDELCDLLREYRLGIHVEERTVTDITVDESFFKTL